MRLLILTSSDHLYANYILKQLLLEGVFNKHEVVVFEQDSIIPNSGRLTGLLRYYKVSGLRYIYPQILKIYIFRFLRLIAYFRKNINSYYFPYDKIAPNLIKRNIVNDICRPEVIERIDIIKPDIILSLFSKEIIPESILNIPKLGSINLHPSYLPAYRGVSPTFWALVNNEKHTGATLHYIGREIDAGRIIEQKKIKIGKYMTEHELYMKCAVEGKELLKKFIINISKYGGGTQNSSSSKKGSYYSLPTRDAVRIFLKSEHKFFALKDFFTNYDF